jgi:hypothetical protein
MTSSDALFKRLAAPFPYQDIDWRVQNTNDENTKGRAVPYLRFQAIADRLDEVVGPMNWENEYVSGPCGGVVCRLSLRIDGEWLRKSNGADNTSFEPVKGGLTDAFKRAAVMWNIGRYLYNCPSMLVDLDPQTGRMVTWPKLPLEMLQEIERAEHGYDAATALEETRTNETVEQPAATQERSTLSEPAPAERADSQPTLSDVSVEQPAVEPTAAQDANTQSANSPGAAPADDAGGASGFTEKDGLTIDDAMDSVPDGLDDAHVKRIRTIFERSWDNASIRPNMRTYVNDRTKSKMPDQAVFYVLEILARLDELDNVAPAV